MAGERILVCDDDPQILRALRLILRGAGYEVLTSASAEEALDRAAVSGPHAAIIDLMLPDRPGIEVCRELRGWSELPIIVLSAVTDEKAKIEALGVGADDYVTKPFAPGELVARVQAVLRRAGRAPDEPRIEADGLVVDLLRDHFPFLVDQEGGPTCGGHGRAADVVLLLQAVRFDCFGVHVAKEREGDSVLLGEGMIGERAVNAHTQDLGV